MRPRTSWSGWGLPAEALMMSISATVTAGTLPAPSDTGVASSPNTHPETIRTLGVIIQSEWE